MPNLKVFEWFASFSVALFVCAGSAHAEDISGTINATLTISGDSKLVGDVVCTVTGGPAHGKCDVARTAVTAHRLDGD